MDLRRLRYFVMIAKERHITRAAIQLGIQQAPLSQQLKVLEQDIGARLFIRKPRGVELTAAGQTLLGHAQRILEQVERATTATRQVGDGAAGTLRIGLTTSASFHPFPANAIRAYRKAYPNMALELFHGSSPELIRKLQALELHVAFTRTTLRVPPDLHIVHLLEEPMVVALPAGHRLARSSGRKALRLNDLAAEIFVAYPHGPGAGLYDALLSVCQANGFMPVIGYEAPQMIGSLSLVGAGLGVTIVPQSLTMVRMDNVVFREITIPQAGHAQLNLVVLKRNAEAAAASFREIVVALANRSP